MPLEPDVDNLDDLVETNPAFDDPVNQGDDHDRITKRGILGNITGDESETRLLSAREVVALINENSLELRPTAAGGDAYQLNFGDAAGSKTHGGLRFDGADLISLINDALTGLMELRGSLLAPDDAKFIAFDPAAGFTLFHDNDGAGARLPVLESTGANALRQKAVDEDTALEFIQETAAGFPTLRIFSGAGVFIIRSEVNDVAVTLSSRNGAGTVRTVFSGDPNAGSNMYFDGVANWRLIAANKVDFGANQVSWEHGAGSPEGVVEAFPGSIYSDESSGSAAPLWMKNFGTGNTGWLQIAFVP